MDPSDLSRSNQQTDSRSRRNQVRDPVDCIPTDVTYDDEALSHSMFHDRTPSSRSNVSFLNGPGMQPYSNNIINSARDGRSNFPIYQNPDNIDGSSICIASPLWDCYCDKCVKASNSEQSHQIRQNGLSEARLVVASDPVNSSSPFTQFAQSNIQGFAALENHIPSSNQAQQLLSLSNGPSHSSTTEQLFSSFDPEASCFPTSFGQENSSYNSNQLANMRYRPTTASLAAYPYGRTPPSSRLLHPELGDQAWPLSAIADSQSQSVPRLPAWTSEYFVKAKNHIVEELQPTGTMTDVKKASLAQILLISIEELDMVIKAITVLQPLIAKVCSASETLGMPKSNVIAWFSNLPTQIPTNPMTRDSGYQSKVTAPKQVTHRAKRRKKTPVADLYQCTYRLSDGTFCHQTSKDQTDWKRHEETHYPQKEWKCMLRPLNSSLTCHEVRNKSFLRRDKLIQHLKTHGSTPHTDIDTWHNKILSDWKRQCGFCGRSFVDWDARCAHVGQHFPKGKRIVPDWKDPWPTETRNFQDDSDDNDDDDDDEDDEDDEDDNDGDYEDGKNRGQDQVAKRGPRKRGPSNNAPRSSRYSSRRSKSSGPNHNHQISSNKMTLQTQSMACNTLTRSSNSYPRTEDINCTFLFVRNVGRGAFGTVDEVLHRPSNTLFARKTIQVQFHGRSTTSSDILKEINALRSLKHQHIVRIMASQVSYDQHSIIMFPIADCNLYQFLNKPSSHTTSHRTLISKWFRCLADALSFMHKNGWLHMDLKPQNILVAGDCIFISDLGSASRTTNSVTDTSKPRHAITPMYCAPEVFKGLVISWACDIFSLGCIFLEMATILHRQSLSDFLQLRQSSSTDCSFKNNIQKCSFWIDHLSEISADIGSLSGDFQIISKMLSLEVQKRPSAQVIRNLYMDEACHNTRPSLLASIRRDYYLVNNLEVPLESASMALSWLAKCESSHKFCSLRDLGFFPTRILFVGGDDITTVRLQAGTEPSPCRYVALSHCWGHTKPLVTTNYNIRERSMGIKCSSLPKVFQHAVQITRALEISYLWIDSLCILQDSQQDWAKESSQMHKIYANSSVTIAATLYADHDLSLFRRRAPDRKALTDKAKTECTCLPGTCKAFKPLLEDNAGTMLLDSPLSQRGWALQERMLSPRVLHFSATRLAWECREASTTIDAASKMRKSIFLMHMSNACTLPQTGSVHTVKEPDISKLQGGEIARTHKPQIPRSRQVWQQLVREYSKRQLSKPQDKLPGIAGLAATIYSLDGCKYLAGLWHDDLQHNLLWSRDFVAPSAARPGKYRAPSWSWAAIDSQVVWSKSVMEIVDGNRATILECNVTPCSSVSPFGAVSDGYLRIRGPVQKAAMRYPYIEQLLEGNHFKPFAFVQLDAKPSHNSNNCSVKHLWCLELVEGIGLVLEEKETGNGNNDKPKSLEEKIFERIGVFWKSIEDSGKEVEEENWKETTVFIV